LTAWKNFRTAYAMSDVELPFPRAATPEVRELLVAAHKFCREAKPKLTIASLSSIIFNSGKQIERLESGCDLTTARLRLGWERLRELEAGGPRTRKPRPDKSEAADAR